MSDRKNTSVPMRNPLWPRVWPGRCTASTVVPPPRSKTWPSVKPWASGRGVKWNSSSDGRRERVVERHAVDVHQALQALHAGQVVDVDVDPGVGERAVAGDVVLVAVAVDDGVDAAPGTPRSTTVTDGSISSDSAAPAHEQRVARRVGAVGRADQHADGVGQPALVVAPVRGHPSNVLAARRDLTCHAASAGVSANWVRLSVA